MKKLSSFPAWLLAAACSCALAGGSGLDESDGGDTSAGAIYKTVGPNGEVVFTDTPPVDGKSERVQLGPINVQPISLPKPIPTRKLSPKDKRDPGAAYSGPVNVTIVSPASGATIPPGQRFIVLQVAIDPPLPQGHRFYAVVDGQRWRGSSSGTSLDISALERGSHSVQALLTDPSGKLLARSQTIMIYVKRPGDQVPEFGAPQATPAPQAPAAPGLVPKKPSRRDGR
ncbi:DUF4124 domain-containing protein [Microbulbifer sp. 2201CG32-9]|uniref:DUF4124 domain-containing protein n=1 Tax=unclassified Microbulbifer TaxID=2619833 RepID=UPI00345C15A0